MWRYFVAKYTYIGVHTQNIFTNQVHNQKFGAHWSTCLAKDENDGCGTKIFHKENPKDWW